MTIGVELEAQILRYYLTLRIMSGNRFSSVDRPKLLGRKVDVLRRLPNIICSR